MAKEDQTKEETRGITVKKEEDFSEWFTQVIKEAELADIRYNVKGFLVYRPWCVHTWNIMYDKLAGILEKKGHQPLIMPTVIPESNFKLESKHVEGFAPAVFWITEHGAGEKIEERLALRPTSETAFYQMFALWIRSYKDLPLKTYQRASVFRYEGKATRPFFRAREFYWIEAHDAFATEKDATNQVKEDMETTKEFLLDELAIPFIFFQRPEWDKFPGAVNTYAADALMPSGKVIQLPSTHMLGQNFSKPFNVKYIDKDGTEKYAYITCYGPAISRIYGALIAFHGDDKGLVLPFDLAPIQIVIVPILFEDTKRIVLKKCYELEKKLRRHYKVKVDGDDEKSAGWKFNYWEMKGVPIRIEIGPNDLKKKQAIVYSRDTGEKETIKEKDLIDHVKAIASDFTERLKKNAERVFNTSIVDADSIEEVKENIGSKIVRVNFCSIDKDGEPCAEIVEKELLASVRGTRFGLDETPKGKCVFCGKPAKVVAYIAKSY
ncbi:proline--tRNA ligase [Candidatus Woesearchaeota archaeon]|nr:MAG: proline--tRNA ligase [Candidatus Woesearchaeota archaeon]